MRKLYSHSADFAAQFSALVNAKRESDADVSNDVSAIIADVRKRGDIAVRELTLQFDKFDLSDVGWEISRDQCRTALAALPNELRSALELAHHRIADYHIAQRPHDSDRIDSIGVRVGARWNDRVRLGAAILGCHGEVRRQCSCGW